VRERSEWKQASSRRECSSELRWITAQIKQFARTAGSKNALFGSPERTNEQFARALRAARAAFLT